MKIAQVSPLFERVPPVSYGGTERIVAYLTDELVRNNHRVTLFASGDSQTSARLIPCCRSGLRLDRTCVDPLAHHLLMLEQVYRMADEFDVVHFHIDYLHYPLTRRNQLTHLTTLHGRLDIPDLVPLYREYREMPVVSISDSQRAPLPWLNWQGTVHHGLPVDLLPFNEKGGGYLAFLGRVSPEKGLHTAIKIARASGITLKIAAKIDKADQEYYDTIIAPLLDTTPQVEFIGEIGEEKKKDFLGNALALVFPIDWEEPFGLVMIESMACGTPVIAYPRGSVPEVIEEGVSGYLVRDVREAVRAVGRVKSLSRRRCRMYFEENFTVERMAADYVALYEKVIAETGRQNVSLISRASTS